MEASEPSPSMEGNNNEMKQLCLAPFSLEEEDILVRVFLKPEVSQVFAKVEEQRVSQEEENMLDEQRVSLEAVSLEEPVQVDSLEINRMEEPAVPLEPARCEEPVVSMELASVKEPVGSMEVAGLGDAVVSLVVGRLEKEESRFDNLEVLVEEAARTEELEGFLEEVARQEVSFEVAIELEVARREKQGVSPLEEVATRLKQEVFLEEVVGQEVSMEEAIKLEALSHEAAMLEGPTVSQLKPEVILEMDERRVSLETECSVLTDHP